MTDFLVKITKNELVDRLRVVESHLCQENEHSLARFVGMAIQIINKDACASIDSALALAVAKATKDAAQIAVAEVYRIVRNDPGRFR